MGLVIEQDLISGEVSVHKGYNSSLTLSDEEARTLVKFLIGALYGHPGTNTRKVALQEVASAYANEPQIAAGFKTLA
jgi:hypothetical protein